jgi:hypothetical protein
MSRYKARERGNCSVFLDSTGYARNLATGISHLQLDLKKHFEPI